jgi:hypothetical protein
MGVMRNAYKILVGKPEGYRPLGIRTGRCRWNDNIWIGLNETRCDCVERIHLVQDNN